MIIPEPKFIVFRAHYGFVVYGHESREISYTQEIESASEATKADWLFVLPDSEFKLIPAGIYVKQLQDRVKYLDGKWTQEIIDRQKYEIVIGFIETNNTLHSTIDILYVVDGYQVNVSNDGNPVGEVCNGKTLMEAMIKLIQSQ